MDQALKQRLVGASVLVVLAVIFLPALLDGSGMEKPVQKVSLDLPVASPDSTVTITLKPEKQTRVVQQTPEKRQIPKQLAAPVIRQDPASQAAVKKPAAEATRPKPEVKPVAKPKPVTKPKPPAPAKPKPAEKKPTVVKKPKPSTNTPQWIVQIGSFSQRENAQTLRDNLIRRGYKSFVEASGQGSQRRYRVRVGPVGSRAKADALKKKLSQREKRNGLVMEYP